MPPVRRAIRSAVMKFSPPSAPPATGRTAKVRRRAVRLLMVLILLSSAIRTCARASSPGGPISAIPTGAIERIGAERASHVGCAPLRLGDDTVERGLDRLRRVVEFLVPAPLAQPGQQH